MTNVDAFAEKSRNARNRRAEVLAHAVRVLNSRGISQTSLGQIADDLGISRAALYYYADDLQDLVFQCYRDTCETLSRKLAEAVHTGGDEAGIIARFIGSSLDPACPEFASLSEIGYLNEAQRAAIMGLSDALLAQLAGVIAKGVSAGRLRTCDAWIAAHTIMSMIFWAPIADGWAPAVRSIPHAPNVEAVTDLVLHGIVAQGVSVGQTVTVDFQVLFPSSNGLFDKEYLTVARREALLRAASQLFNRKGIDATSLEDIASSVGATKRAIQHYFGDKQRLVEQAYKRAYHIYLLVPEVLADSELGPIEKLASAWTSISEAYLREDVSPLMSRAGFEGFSDAARQGIEELSTRLTNEYRAILAAAREAGELRDFDDAGFLVVVAGAFAWLARGIFSCAPADYRRVGSEISDLLTRGIALARHDRN